MAGQGNLASAGDHTNSQQFPQTVCPCQFCASVERNSVHNMPLELADGEEHVIMHLHKRNQSVYYFTKETLTNVRIRFLHEVFPK